MHEYKSMQALLNKVMYDLEVKVGVFVVVLTLGNGGKVKAKTRMRIHASMSEEELSKFEPMIYRRELESQVGVLRRRLFGRQQLMHLRANSEDTHED